MPITVALQSKPWVLAVWILWSLSSNPAQGSFSSSFRVVFPVLVRTLRRSNHSFKEGLSSVKIRSSETSRRGGLGSPSTIAPQGMKERSRTIHNGNKFNLPFLPSLEPFFSSILISHFNRQSQLYFSFSSWSDWNLYWGSDGQSNSNGSVLSTTLAFFYSTVNRVFSSEDKGRLCVFLFSLTSN
jgi:hypothetical protein